ncbi:MAG: glycosyltransferase family 9 protein [Bdellovibrionaceae bacterium]|nr:glycosyltransferase family 9 protein [Pseudobdellovibrionaceae bacterium]MDW8190582.1 glycosyltransferase family 9 protein [Pseudobdellovibrionaceae bacterium]
MSPKVLIIRFSSIGDVTQTLSAAYVLHQNGFEVHWAIRIDLAPLVAFSPYVRRVWSLERRKGFLGLWDLALKLRRENFTHIYDAHDSLRSRFLFVFLKYIPTRKNFFKKRYFLRRPLYRFRRWIWIQFKKNLLPTPKEAQWQILEPLKVWGLNPVLPNKPVVHIDPNSLKIVEGELAKIQLSQFIALCPGAAHPLKRWPINYFKTIIQLNPKERFVILGGPFDTFADELVATDPDRVFNYAGRLTLLESAAMIQKAKVVITNDTGLMHLAEQLLKPTIALIGPSLFGYPVRHTTTTHVLENHLECRPCSRHGEGPCRNPIYQQCLQAILPQRVDQVLKNILQTL